MKVEMFTSAYCPYCMMAERLLKAKGVPAVEKYRIDQSDDAMRAMLTRSNGRRSVPQIFINDTHVGGFDDLAALERAGQLEPLLARGTPET